MVTARKIQSVSFENDSMSLMVDGKQIKVLLETISPRLKNANEIQRNFYKISPSGYGIHWPLIDEDISIEAIFKSL